MLRKYRFFILLLLITLCLPTACSQGDTETFVGDPDTESVIPPRLRNEPDGPKPPMPTETPYNASFTNDGFDWTGFVPSRLTGLPIPEDLANKRPIAVVVNNLFPALPQSGISQADLIYEVLAEGNITRLVAIFQYHDAPKIGPVRSARDYFVDFALDYDAIFIHHGGSPSGYSRLSNLRINRLDGINWEGTYFWRDRTYPDWDSLHAGQTRSMEHSSYINSEKIQSAIEALDFRTERYEDEPFGFAFNTEALPPSDETTTVSEIQVPFSKDYTRRFVYDPETRMYAVFNKNGPHWDANTQEALYVANILIQDVKMRVIAGDEAGRREVSTVGTGTGWLATGGDYVPIRWEKDDHTLPTRWFFEDDSELHLNVGKTWICVVQDSGQVVINGAE